MDILLVQQSQLKLGNKVSNMVVFPLVGAVVKLPLHTVVSISFSSGVGQCGVGIYHNHNDFS